MTLAATNEDRRMLALCKETREFSDAERVEANKQNAILFSRLINESPNRRGNWKSPLKKPPSNELLGTILNKGYQV